LLSLVAAANAKDGDLIKAASRGDVQRVKELIGANADVNAKSKDGGTALMEAAFKGYADIVALLLDKGADIEASNKVGATALNVAARARTINVVSLLLNRGAKTEARDRMFRHTALMEAAVWGYADIITLLLDKGADIEAYGSLLVVDEHGNPVLVDLAASVTPLIVAAANGRADVVGLLIHRGANIEARDEKGRTALSLATLFGRADARNLLQKATDAMHSTEARNGPTALSAPPPTTHLAGLYRSEPPNANSSSDRQYLRLCSDGTVTLVAVNGDGGPKEIASIARWLHKPFQFSGKYQIQEMAIRFSIPTPQGTTDYQGQVEGTALSLDIVSHSNGYRGHATYQLLQPGDCE